MKKLLTFLAITAISLTVLTAYPWPASLLEEKEVPPPPAEEPEKPLYTIEDPVKIKKGKRQAFNELSYIIPSDKIILANKIIKPQEEFYNYITDIYYALFSNYPTIKFKDKMIQDIKNCLYPLEFNALWRYPAKNYEYKIDEKHSLEFRFNFSVLDGNRADEQQYGGEYDIILATDKNVYTLRLIPSYHLKDFAEQLSDYIYFDENGNMGPNYYWVNDKSSMKELTEKFMNKDSSLPKEMIEFSNDFERFLASIKITE
ncbi:MAG: hypothetical protein II098_05965 [Treponema sp.]|nr:hypothetical protein [Treponema sp.]